MFWRPYGHSDTAHRHGAYMLGARSGGRSQRRVDLHFVSCGDRGDVRDSVHHPH